MENKSGINPCGYRVLILPDVSEEASSIIEIPDSAKERLALAQAFGRVVAVGAKAWTSEVLGPVPWAKQGDRVGFGRYAGLVLKGKDKVHYRLVNDEDITALLDEEVELGE